MDIHEGQLYACGPHRLGCGDLLTEQWERFFGEIDYDWVYSDPPWGEGNARYWRTINGQKDVPPVYHDLLNRWADVVSQARYGAYGVMGMRWPRILVDRMEQRGWRLDKEYRVTYGSPRRPCLLQLFSPSGVSHPSYPDIEGLHSFTAVRAAFQLFSSDGTVADPCIGLGNTLRAGHERGLRVIGMELNPKRLQRCLEYMNKQGLTPKLLTPGTV